MLLTRGVFLFSTFLFAVCVPHFDLLMGLTGSLTGALLSFIFPCIFHIHIKKLKLEYYQVFFDICILLMGTVCSVTGVYRSGNLQFGMIIVITSGLVTLLAGKYVSSPTLDDNIQTQIDNMTNIYFVNATSMDL